MKIASSVNQEEVDKMIGGLTYEDAINIIETNLNKDLSKGVNVFFGEQNVERLRQLLGSETYKETDAMFVSGELKLDQLQQYITILDDFYEGSMELRTIIFDMMEHVSRKLSYQFSRSFDKKGVFHGKGIVKILNAVNDIILGWQSKEFPSVSLARLTALKIFLINNVVFEVLKLAEKRCNRNQIFRILEYYTTLTDPLDSSNSPIFKSTVATFVYQSTKIRSSFDDRSDLGIQKLNELGNDMGEKKEDIRELNLIRLLEIRDATFFARVPHSEFQLNKDIRIIIYSEEETRISENSRAYELCEFKIQFCNRPDVGDLDFLFMKNTGLLIPYRSGVFAEKFLDEKALEVLKARILEHLLEVMIDQPSEIEDFFEQEEEQERVDVMMLKTEDSVAEVLDEVSPVFYEYVPYKPEEMVVESESVDDKKQVKKLKRGPALQGKFSGLKGSRVKSILYSILGPELRVRGSHHIFKGLNGKIYPIAIHEGAAVGTGMLIRCLKNWGILRRFYEEL